MNNTKASSRAIENLNFAFKRNKIDIATYHHEKELVETRLNAIYDDGLTRSIG